MDIKARKEINTADNTTRIALSQQEVMKMLMGEEEPVLTKADKEQAIDLD